MKQLEDRAVNVSRETILEVFLLEALWNAFFEGLSSVLPLSPFSAFIDSLEFDSAFTTGLSWLNWFIPVSAFVSIILDWLVAVGLYFLYQAVMRWVGMIR